MGTQLVTGNALLVAAPEVWMEGAAVEQLKSVAEMPGCRLAVGLPDLHPGPGIPVGAALAFQGRILPGLVGSDAGCGVRVTVVPRGPACGDALERRIRAATEGPALPEADPEELLEAVWHRGPRGLAAVAGVPDSLARLAEAEPDEVEGPSGAVPQDPELGRALGTIGGGNHFLELGSVDRLPDREAAAAFGLKRGQMIVLAHSGSRGLGRSLALQWGDAPLEGDRIADYLADLRGACRFARANRLVLSWRMLSAVGATRPERLGPAFDVVHNTVVEGRVEGDPVWIHRKGAAPAEAGQTTVVLGSRGAPSYLLTGTGQASTLCCVAHGAGRRMGRAEALGKLKHKHTRAALTRNAQGGRVICDDPELLYTEHPDAYKPIEPIISSLESAGMATTLALLRPLFTVKR